MLPKRVLMAQGLHKSNREIADEEEVRIREKNRIGGIPTEGSNSYKTINGIKHDSTISTLLFDTGSSLVMKQQLAYHMNAMINTLSFLINVINAKLGIQEEPDIALCVTTVKLLRKQRTCKSFGKEASLEWFSSEVCCKIPKLANCLLRRIGRETSSKRPLVYKDANFLEFYAKDNDMDPDCVEDIINTSSILKLMQNDDFKPRYSATYTKFLDHMDNLAHQADELVEEIFDHRRHVERLTRCLLRPDYVVCTRHLFSDVTKAFEGHEDCDFSQEDISKAEFTTYNQDPRTSAIEEVRAAKRKELSKRKNKKTPDTVATDGIDHQKAFSSCKHPLVSSKGSFICFWRNLLVCAMGSMGGTSDRWFWMTHAEAVAVLPFNDSRASRVALDRLADS